MVVKITWYANKSNRLIHEKSLIYYSTFKYSRLAALGRPLRRREQEISQYFLVEVITYAIGAKVE